MNYARKRGRSPGKRGRRLRAAAVLALLAFTWAGPVRAEGDWKQALAPRPWSFPGDHGAHPEYRTEWWYFTGTLAADAGGGRYGYQLTFFRQGVVREPRRPGNPWSVRDLHLAHFALTDVSGRTFRYADRLSRAGPGLAGASTGRLAVWNLDWSARMEGKEITLAARTPDFAVELTLAPRKPVVLHGEKGLSRKGPRPGQASHYASLTDLATTGRLRRAAGDPWVPVRGTSWFDQEFGSNQLGPDQAGWDWVSLHLSDGRDLMVYVLRKTDGTVEPASSGTLVEPDGRSRRLPLADFSLEPVGRWVSPRTGARYPSGWRLRVRSADLDLRVDPWLADQELVTEGSTGVTYWEGAVGGRGTSGGRAVSCEGYVELTGYGGKLGGLF